MLPTQTDEAIHNQVLRNYRHNFLMNALDGASYWFGFSFITPTIILPLYINHFTSSPLLIGLIGFISTAGFLLPQLFTANLVERAPLKRVFPVKYGFFFERIPVLLFAPSALLFALDSPTWALISFFLLYIWYNFGTGLTVVGWQDMFAKVFPVETRGKAFGITNFIGTASGTLGGVALGVVLVAFPFPMGFVYSFAAAGVLVFISWVFVAQIREPAVISSKPRVSQAEYFRALPPLLRRDRNFRKYLLAQVIFSFSMMANGFLIVYVTQHWNMPDSAAAWFTIATQVGQSIANLFFGFLSDRKGHKLNLELSALMSALSFGLAFLASAPGWFYLIFFLRGAVTSINILSGISIAMEFSAPEDRPTYIGLANTIPGIVSSIAPLVGGLLAGGFGYAPVFALSGLIGLVGFWLLRWQVQEPRLNAQARPAQEAGSL